MAAELDEVVEGFRSRWLDGGPYLFVWIDALTQKVREGGRTVNVHCLVATGVNADGHREILGVEVASDLTPDGLAFAIFYTKVRDRVLAPLFTAGQPQSPPQLHAALTTIQHHIDDRLASGRLPTAA